MKGLILEDTGGRLASGKEYLSSRIERLVFIPEDSVLGYPDWGSRISSEFLQEPEDETAADEIINEMSFLFQSREPDIILDSVYVNILGTDSGSNGIIVNLNVFGPDESEVENIEFFKIVEVT